MKAYCLPASGDIYNDTQPPHGEEACRVRAPSPVGIQYSRQVVHARELTNTHLQRQCSRKGVNRKVPTKTCCHAHHTTATNGSQSALQDRPLCSAMLGRAGRTHQWDGDAALSGGTLEVQPSTDLAPWYVFTDRDTKEFQIQ